MGTTRRGSQTFRSSLLTFALTFLAAISTAQDKTFDGVWWQASPATEQNGFILGYGDCYTSREADQVRVIAEDADVRVAISTFYAGHQNQRARPASRVLRDVWSGHLEVRDPRQSRPGDGWSERHGFLDGGWWASSTSAEQRGFIAGFQTCHNTEQQKEAPLRDSVSTYMAEVNRWYQEPGDDQTVAQRRATKVSEVLRRLNSASSSHH
jgi:hypothetical protein